VRRQIVLIATLCVLIAAQLSVAKPAGAVTPAIVDLRTPAWRAYLDPTGDPASADTNTLVLNHVFASVPAGTWVILPDDAVYATSGVLTIPVDGTVVTGTATLRSMVPAASAVFVDGDLVRIVGLRVRGTATTRDQRRSNPGASGFVLRDAGASLTDVQVYDVAGSGILTLNAVLFRLVRPVVVNSQADGIHMTSASSHGVVDDAAVFGSGDDGVAVVSYVANVAPTSHITVNNPVVYMSDAPPNYPYSFAWGRAYAVSGGTDVTFNNVVAINSAGAAIFIAAEPATGWNTRGVSQVRVNGGRLIGSNIDRTLCADPVAPCIDHGAVLLWSANSGLAIDDVRIEGLTIQDTNLRASRQTSILAVPGAGVSRILFRDLTFIGGPATRFWANDEVPSDAYSTVCLTVAPSMVLTNHLGYQPIPEPGVTCGTPSA